MHLLSNILTIFYIYILYYNSNPVLWKKGEQTEKQPVHGSDVAAGVVAIILDNNTAGKTYQFVGYVS